MKYERGFGVYAYANLDASGEADIAAQRMELRAQDPASDTLFDALLRPLLEAHRPAQVLELGAGSGALSRKMAEVLPAAQFLVTDLSAGMLAFAARQASISPEKKAHMQFAQLDAANAALPAGPFDLIISSVMLPYMDDAAIRRLASKLPAVLAPGGHVVFMEQALDTIDWQPLEKSVQDTLFGRARRVQQSLHGAGVAAALREAGLEVQPLTRGVWLTHQYGPYLRDLVARCLRDCIEAEVFTPESADALQATILAAESAGSFRYALTYDCVVATRRR
jgi:SAM-dependent methyltransferase